MEHSAAFFGQLIGEPRARPLLGEVLCSCLHDFIAVNAVQNASKTVNDEVWAMYDHAGLLLSVLQQCIEAHVAEKRPDDAPLTDAWLGAFNELLDMSRRMTTKVFIGAGLRSWLLRIAVLLL